MSVNMEQVGKVILIKLESRLDVFKSVETEDEIIKLIDNGNKYLLFDLSDVIYISSSGLRIFITTIRKLRELDGMLKVAGMKENIKTVFRTIELIDLLELYDNKDEALEAFGDIAK